jgi:hypothetical protein
VTYDVQCKVVLQRATRDCVGSLASQGAGYERRTTSKASLRPDVVALLATARRAAFAAPAGEVLRQHARLSHNRPGQLLS